MGIRFFGRYRRLISGLFVILFMNWVAAVVGEEGLLLVRGLWRMLGGLVKGGFRVLGLGVLD